MATKRGANLGGTGSANRMVEAREADETQKYRWMIASAIIIALWMRFRLDLGPRLVPVGHEHVRDCRLFASLIPCHNCNGFYYILGD